MKKAFAGLMAIILIIQVLLTGADVSAQTSSNITRDTVLLLDCSGSMQGTPLTVMKEAAEKFCSSVLAASGTNRVAIVDFENNATVKTSFTNNQTDLKSAIESAYAYGGTNTQGAIAEADTLMKQDSAAKIKNIVLLTDGLPTDGDCEYNGKYNSNDYDGYYYANSAYNQFSALKDDYYFYTLGFFHNLSGNDLTFGRKFLNDIQNAGYYEVTDPSQLKFTFGQLANDITKVKKSGMFAYSSGDKQDYTTTYFYDDDYFSSSSYTYNQSLGTMSLCLAMSAFGSNEADYSNKSKNANALLTDVGFTDFDTNSWFTVQPTRDSIAVAAASKPYKADNGDVCTLIAAAVRGSGYGAEWASNFTLGTTGEHQGFSEARDNALAFLKSYIAKYKITGKIKLWITGYSRAAATANMMAGALDNGESLGSGVVLNPSDIYAYCFETPAGSLQSITKNKSSYQNIFSIVNPSDPVTKVAPFAYGFARYGIDKTLPAAQNDNNYNADRSKMLEKYNQIPSASKYVVDNFRAKKIGLLPLGIQDDSNNVISQDLFLNNFVNELAIGIIKSRANYVKTYQADIRETMGVLTGTTQDQWNAFENGLRDKFMDDLPHLIFLQASNPIGNGIGEELGKLVVESLNAAKITNYTQNLIRFASAVAFRIGCNPSA